MTTIVSNVHLSSRISSSYLEIVSFKYKKYNLPRFKSKFSAFLVNFLQNVDRKIIQKTTIINKPQSSWKISCTLLTIVGKNILLLNFKFSSIKS